MSRREYPSIEFVRQSLRYEDGKLFWLERPEHHFKTSRDCRAWNTRYSRSEAGCVKPQCGGPRCTVNLNKRDIYRYHVVWALHTGEWANLIDHENHNQLDDRIENLRPANQSQNLANACLRSDNASGCKGVSWHPKRRKWRVRINVDCKEIGLGFFADLNAAKAAYAKAAQHHFGEFAHAG